jgi:hypothetical protein
MFNDYFVNIVSELGASFTTTEEDTSKLESFVSSKLENYITQFNIPNIYNSGRHPEINLPSGNATGPS